MGESNARFDSLHRERSNALRGGRTDTARARGSDPIARKVFDGLAGYSALVDLPDGSIGLLYEACHHEKYERIDFARFDLDWLTDGGREGAK
jgi:hypothetical protein